MSSTDRSLTSRRPTAARRRASSSAAVTFGQSHLAAPQVVALDGALRGDEPLRELGLAHLEREHDRGPVVPDRGVLEEVGRQRASCARRRRRRRSCDRRGPRCRTSRPRRSCSIDTTSSQQTSDSARSRSSPDVECASASTPSCARESRARADVPVVVARMARRRSLTVRPERVALGGQDRAPTPRGGRCRRSSCDRRLRGRPAPATSLAALPGHPDLVDEPRADRPGR